MGHSAHSNISSNLSRRCVLSAAAAMSLGAVPFLGGRQARAAATFVVQGTGGSWGDMEQRVFVKPFREANKDVNVVWAGAADDGVVISKMLLNCGKPEFAVADVNTNVGPLVLARGCVQGFDASLMPNLKYVAKEAVLEAPGVGPYFASSNLAILGVVWNTKLARKPSSWNDVWSADYKGKIGIPDFVWTGQDWLPAISKLHGGSEDDPKPGLDAIGELVHKNGAVILHNTDQAIQLFQSGAIVMAPFWNGRTFSMQQKGVSVAIEYVPNSVFVGDGYIIMKGNQTPDLAQRYVNETIDGEKALAMMATTGYPPSDTRVKLPPNLAAGAVTAQQLANVVPVDWAKVAENRDKTLQAWNEEVNA